MMTTMMTKTVATAEGNCGDNGDEEDEGNDDDNDNDDRVDHSLSRQR